MLSALQQMAQNSCPCTRKGCWGCPQVSQLAPLGWQMFHGVSRRPESLWDGQRQAILSYFFMSSIALTSPAWVSLVTATLWWLWLWQNLKPDSSEVRWGMFQLHRSICSLQHSFLPSFLIHWGTARLFPETTQQILSKIKIQGPHGTVIAMAWFI